MKMKEIKDKIKILSEKYNKKENIIKIMLYKTLEEGYDVNSGINLINSFFNNTKI